MSKTILLADDSVTIRKVVELTFMEEDWDLVSLGSGEEALEQLAGVDPDLVLADVHMPGVSGYEVCRRAKELRADRPVLLLVGTFEPFDADELAASGADTHLKKPFDSQELLQTVRDLLREGTPAPAAAFDTGELEAPEAAAPAGSFFAAEELAGAAEGSASAESAEPEAGESAEGPEAVEAAAAPDREAAAASGNGGGELSDEAVDRIARRVAELLGPDAVREVAWEVIPDLAEVVIKERLRELESQVE